MNVIDMILAGALAAGILASDPGQHQHPPPPPAKPAEPAPVPQEHVHDAMAPGGWHFMQDGVAFLTYNNQGGPRGDTEVISQNWWMGMASRPAGGGQLTFSLMLSLDPLTQPGDGYAALFQTGETWKGEPIVDRQHPHDFLMQAAVMWRVAVGGGYHLTLAGAPVGEPTLGPVAFMHRQSAAENLAAALGHHTLDSTHIAHGVIAAGVDNGPWAVEGSIFRGKEPDENRWDLMDIGPLDSWAVRGWYRPSETWEFQASHGFLNEPEALEHVDIRRTTLSGAWLREHATGWTAASLIFGHNDKSEGAGNSVLLAEATHRIGLTSFFGRFETVQVETDVLLTGGHGDHHDEPLFDPAWVTALTAGAARDLLTWRGFEVAAGGDLTAYRVPDVLQPAYGDAPLSFRVFLRVRPPAPMGRMWNHVMTRPMRMR
ncbi:MAG TPA: hypothetical protein VMN81_09650 [Vicinamibacterales bacterium]|nr:hypothetical protein [Vicinamibacterales bacterium]